MCSSLIKWDGTNVFKFWHCWGGSNSRMLRGPMIPANHRHVCEPSRIRLEGPISHGGIKASSINTHFLPQLHKLHATSTVCFDHWKRRWDSKLDHPMVGENANFTYLCRGQVESIKVHVLLCVWLVPSHLVYPLFHTIIRRLSRSSWESGWKWHFNSLMVFNFFRPLTGWKLVVENVWVKIVGWKRTSEFEGVICFNMIDWRCLSVICTRIICRNVVIQYWFKWFY